MGITRLLSCFSGAHGPAVDNEAQHKPSRHTTDEFAVKANIGNSESTPRSMRRSTVDPEDEDKPSLPPLPGGKKLSKRKLAKLQAAEAAAAERTRAEDEETMSQYLGKSASCSSLNSLPRVLSETSLSRCVTPERRMRDPLVQFDEDGNVLLGGSHNRIRSLGSETSWTMSSSPSSLMATPDLSDRLLDLPSAAERLDMSDRTSMTHSVSASDFAVLIDAEGNETVEYIPKALRSVSNPRFDLAMEESVFKPYADAWTGTVLVGRNRKPGEESQEIKTGMRRNMSWSHFSEISLGIRSSSSEANLNRRHTVLVLTNDIEDDDSEGDAREEDGAGAKEGSIKSSHSGGQLPRKVSQVFESHHVHLSKLQEQMGDSNHAPEDLLQLMSRRIFMSQSDLASVSSMNDKHDHEGMNAQDALQGALSEGPSTMSSHDLSDCSDRLPKIRTRFS